MKDWTNEELSMGVLQVVRQNRRHFVDSEAEALEEAAARLRQQSEDSARLDWAETRLSEWSRPVSDPAETTYVLEWFDENDDLLSIRATSLREAIDKARKA